MKTLFTFSILLFAFLLTLTAQQKAFSKAGNNSNQQEEIIYEPVQEAVPISEMNEGSGGLAVRFYYGDPSGMFLNQEWEEGKALLIDGSTIEGSFRYNLYEQKMQAIVDADTFAFAKPCELDVLAIGDSKFIYSTFVRGDHEVANAWFEVLCEGDCSLLLRRYIKYRVSDGDDDLSNDQLYRLEDYYTKKENGAVERMYMSKKSVLALMQDHETEVSEYMKSEKLKPKERSELVSIFAYYNTLD